MHVDGDTTYVLIPNSALSGYAPGKQVTCLDFKPIISSVYNLP